MLTDDIDAIFSESLPPDEVQSPPTVVHQDPVPHTVPKHGRLSEEETAGSRPSTPMAAAAGAHEPYPVSVGVESHFRGNELLSITYFLIRVKIQRPDAAGVRPYPTVSPPPVSTLVPVHMRHLHYELHPISWTPEGRESAQEIVIQRRYSEVLTLRELLTYQFPHLLIPPLTPKSSMANLETAMNNNNALLEQSFNLQFFFKQLTSIPEVLCLSHYVKSFLTDPRQDFEKTTFPMILQKVEDFRAASRPVDELSGAKKEFTSSTAAATNAISSTATKVVKSLFGLFSKTPESGAPLPSVYPSGPAPEGQNGSPPTAEEVEQDIAYWNTVCQELTVRRAMLKKAGAAYSQYLIELNKENNATIHVATAAQAFATELEIRSFGETRPSITTVRREETESGAETLPEAAECFPPLSEGLKAWGNALLERVDVEKTLRRQQFSLVCLKLYSEAHFIKSILYRVDDILALYAYVQHSGLYQPHSPMRSEALVVAAAISRSVHQCYEESYRPGYLSRMHVIKSSLLSPFKEWLAHAAKSESNNKDVLKHYLHRLPDSFVARVREDEKEQQTFMEKANSNEERAAAQVDTGDNHLQTVPTA